MILALGSAARPVAILPAIIFLGGGVGSVFAINILVSLLQLCIMRARIFSCLRQNACVQNTPVVSASCSPVSFIRPDSLTIVSTAWLIIPSIDRLMLPAYVSLEDYGRYALIASLGILPASFAGPLSSALIPAIAEAYSKNDLARVRKLFQQSLRISAMLPLGVLAIMFGFSAEIPALVFGQDAVTAGDQQILRQISLSFGLYSLIVPGYAILVATNQQIRVTTAMLLAAILVPALIAILGSRLGTSSGPIAMSISYVLLVAVVYSICGKLMNYRRLQLIRALLTAASPAAIGLAYSWLKEDPSPLNLGTMPNVVVLATVLGINFTLIFKSRIL